MVKLHCSWLHGISLLHDLSVCVSNVFSVAFLCACSHFSMYIISLCSHVDIMKVCHLDISKPILVFVVQNI
jgi:hypothetical protein